MDDRKWRFWDVLLAPSAFPRDPYGELTNQLGHTMLGIILAIFVVCLWREAAGEMPYRWSVFAVVVLGYLIGIEVLSQGWTPGDSWFDAAMVGFGAAGLLFPLKEVAPEGDMTILALNHHVLIWLLSMWAVALAVRVWRRTRA